MIYNTTTDKSSKQPLLVSPRSFPCPTQRKMSENEAVKQHADDVILVAAITGFYEISFSTNHKLETQLQLQLLSL